MKVIAGILIAIALFALPVGVQVEGGDDGLVAEWHFDEGSGSVLADSSGNGNDGVIHGATWVEGKYGKALSFDGVNDYVEVPDSPSLDITDTITIEAWVEPASTIQDSGAAICTKGTGAGGESWNLDIISDGFRFMRRQNDGASYIKAVSGTFSSVQWYHLVGVVDGGHILIYVNGVKTTGNSYTRSFDINDHIVSIGSRQHRSGAYDLNFNGIIDETRIYNRALTADEIKSHYEGKQTELTLTKSAAPHSIKQGQTTTITLTVKNTGTTAVTDIEVSDTIPSDRTIVSGETSKTYTSLRPKDSREFQYTLQPSYAGTFNLDPATATYSDEEGDYHTAESKTAAITVIPSTDQPATPRTAPKSSAEISTASVHLHGEKTDVVLGEDVLLKLSAVNIIGNPLMHVQVIIIPPSGWSVTSSAFAKTGAGQYTTTYDIESGVGRDIEVRIMPNQIGNDFQVQGRIIYYFGDDSDAREDHTLALPITVRAEAENMREAERTADSSESEEASASGFAAVVAIIGLLLAYWRETI
jgi:uncharacterized repeat protein (TIGR01451 family)